MKWVGLLNGVAVWHMYRGGSDQGGVKNGASMCKLSIRLEKNDHVCEKAFTSG